MFVLCVSIICRVSCGYHLDFIWFENIVPICEKSSGSLVLLIGVVYLFSCIVGVSECFISYEFEYLVGSHFVVLFRSNNHKFSFADAIGETSS